MTNKPKFSGPKEPGRFMRVLSLETTTAQIALDALTLLDDTLQFSDWENGNGEEIGDQLRKAVEALKADIAHQSKGVAE